MSLRLCVLASGSSGNCTYIASDRTSVLIDAGLSYRETAARLETIGVDMNAIDAVCVTHEHSDHRSSLRVISKRTGAGLFANSATIEAIEQDEKLKGLNWNVFTVGSSFAVGDLCLDAFSVPHDSYDPVGFVVSSGETKVCVVTDMGMATGVIRDRMRGCSAVIVEANHDEEMLRESSRPWSLKQRIAGRQGHLSNRQAGELIAEVAGPVLQYTFLAHLSSDCNEPQLALDTVQKQLVTAGISGVEVKLTYPDKASDVVDI